MMMGKKTMNPEIARMIQGFMQGVSGSGQIGLSPWAVDHRRLSAGFQLARDLRSENQPMPVSESRRGSRLASGSFATRIGNVAIIPVLGPLVSRMSWSSWSYDEIIRDLRLAAEGEGIEAILLDIDSPGGMVANVDSVPDEICRICEAVPVHAHIGGLGASAAYWIASAAQTVTASKTALVGSVGALIRYVDMEGILTKLGASVVEVIAEQSPNKRLDPDSEEGQAELQSIVDHAGELFIQGLMKSRNASRETILEMYGQGTVFPADESLKRGMIDGVMSFEEILAKMADRQGSESTAVAATAHGKTETLTMDPKETGAVQTVPLTLDTLRANNADLVAAIAAEAMEAERQRIIGIDAHAVGAVGHDELIAAMKADGKTTPEQAGAALWTAEKARSKNDQQALADRLKGLDQLDRAAEGIESTPSATGENGTASFPENEEGWKAKWDSSDKLKSEFPTAESYVATMRRDSARA